MRRTLVVLVLLGAIDPAFAQNQINGSPISQLPQAATPLSGTEIAPLVQGGTTKQVPLSTLLGAPIAASALRWTSVTAFPYSADPTGVNDSTVAFQNALASGTTALYIPPGNYKVCGVVIPNTFYLHIFGAGTASKITQTNCGSPVFSWPTTAMAYSSQTISDLYFESTGGNANTIDTSGEGVLTLRSLYFHNTPTNHDNIFVNGANATQTHDVRIIDLRAYSDTPGNAGLANVEFGALAADSSVDLMYADGGFTNTNSIKLDTGSVDVQVSNSHIYNTLGNVVLNQGSYNNFTQDTFDFSSGADIFANNGASHTAITGGYIQGIQAGHSGVAATNSSVLNIVNEKFSAASGAVSAVVDDIASNNTVVDVADIGTLGDYSSVFNFAGSGSYAARVPGYAPLGLLQAYSGTTTSAQAQNTTVWIGQNGGVANSPSSNYLTTAFTAGFAGTVLGANIAVDATPASGQTFTFTLFKGVTSLGSCTISNTQFGCTIAANATMAVYDSLYVQSAFSATSGSANVRLSINVRG